MKYRRGLTGPTHDEAPPRAGLGAVDDDLGGGHRDRVETSPLGLEAQGGSLPALKSLRLGMTQEHVEAVVGPPSSEGIRPDGSVWKIITRPGSFYWVELDYDANGRLRSFRKDCF